MSGSGNLEKAIPLPSIRRYPSYLRAIKKLKASGEEWVSASLIAKELELSSILVRKDLACTGLEGRPKYGFEINPLISAIEHSLGWDNATDAILVGAGNLGSALAGYNGFSQYGLQITAVFDNDPVKIGQMIHEKPILSIDKMKDYLERTKIAMGVLTVSPQAAQKAAEQMVEAGIKGIWNFATTKLDLPSNVIVQRTDLSAGFAELSTRMR